MSTNVKNEIQSVFNLSFDNIPYSLNELHYKVDKILKILSQFDKTVELSDKLMSIEELTNFLPEHAARQTIYGWVNSDKIPYEKHGKRLYFRQSKITKWIDEGRKSNF